MGHIGLVESAIDLLLEVLVEHVDHRTLAQRGQGLVSGLGGVDPDPDLVRVGQAVLLSLFPSPLVPLAERAVARAPASDSGVHTAVAERTPDASIAVLLFRTVGGGPESEYFSEGMTEDVIAALSSVPGLRVAARTSSFSFRSKNDDVRRIGAELGVATVLDGSVRQSGQRLRVTAQLIDVKTGYNLWSERWDRDLADVFAVQDELARAIAATFTSRSSGPHAVSSSSPQSQPAKMVAPVTRDVVAYDHFLKGRYFWNRRRLHESITELEAAVERDPDFDEAYMALSEAWAAWGFYGGIPTWESWARGRAAAERAEELAPDSAFVPLCLGVLEHYYGWNSAREERFLRLAIARNPASAEAHFWLAFCLGWMGRLDEALAVAREGVRLEPHSPNARAAVGWPLLIVGRYEEAAAELAAAVALGDSPFALWSSGTVLSALGRHEQAPRLLEARAHAARPIRAVFGMVENVERLTHLAADLGDRQQAYPGRRKLDRERQAGDVADKSRDLGCFGPGIEVRRETRGALLEQPHRVVGPQHLGLGLVGVRHRQPFELHDPLGRYTEAPARGHEPLQTAALGQPFREPGLDALERHARGTESRAAGAERHELDRARGGLCRALEHAQSEFSTGPGPRVLELGERGGQALGATRAVVVPARLRPGDPDPVGGRAGAARQGLACTAAGVSAALRHRAAA